MKLATIALAGLISSTAFAQSAPPVSFTYNWSLSGKQYALADYPLRRDVFGVKNLTFGTVAGYEVKETNAPVFGVGLSYNYLTNDGLYFGAGLRLLGPQKQKPDVALGVSFGVRF